MGIVSSIRDFIGGEPDYEEYEGYEEGEFEEEPSDFRRSFTSRFSSRRDHQDSANVVENDITIIKVRKHEDAIAIADVLKTRRPVIFDVIEMENSADAERVVDFMSGAVHGVDGSIKRVSGGIFIATPAGMKITSDEIRKKATTAGFGGFDL